VTFPGLRSYLSGLRELVELPKAARAEYWRDQRGLPSRDPGPEAVVRAGFEWLALDHFS
jgi:hypothetical protein